MHAAAMPSARSRAFNYIDYVRIGGDIDWDFFGWLCVHTYARTTARGDVVVVRNEDDSVRFRITRRVRPPLADMRPICHRWCDCDYEMVGTHTRENLLRAYEVESARTLFALAGRVEYAHGYEEDDWID